MFRIAWIALLGFAVTPLVAPAQEYAIKLGKPGPGDQSQVKADNSTEVEFKILDSNGQAIMEKKEVKGHNFIFRETGIERAAGGGDLVKLKRAYKKAARIVDGDRRTLPFQGETVMIEKSKDGPFSFQIVDGETLMGEDIKELHEEFNKGGASKLVELFLPRKAVKAGETWKVDVNLLAKEFSKDGKIEIDAAKSTGSGKFVKAYQKDGKQFGVMELTVTMAVSHLVGDDGNKNPTKVGKITIKIELDGAIDGSLAETKTKLTIDGEIRASLQVNGMDVNVEINLSGKVDDQRTPVK
jgi:hypothetical protein